MISLRCLDICLHLLEHLENIKRQIKNSMYYTGLSNGPLEGINNKIKVIKRISYGYRSLVTLKQKYSLYSAYLHLLKP